VDIQDRLDELVVLLESARTMPMSASCVVNRAELISRIRDITKRLPEEIFQAQRVLAHREEVVEEGRRQAERIIAEARTQRGTLLSGSALARQAYAEAERIRQQGLREASELRSQVDEYVDRKLANYEVILAKALAAVGQGREMIRSDEPGGSAALWKISGPRRSVDEDQGAGTVLGFPTAETSSGASDESVSFTNADDR
jgi:F0F1-type ATP synthase membrane subunit b/b'